MALISLQDVCWGFGEPPLLEHITLQVEKGQRICLLGRNGAGKSSLLRLMTGAILPDSGDIRCQQGIRIAAMAQDVPSGFDGTIFDVVARGLSEIEQPTDPNRRLAPALNAGPGNALDRTVDSILSRTGLAPEKRFADLSAGMKRRTLFARALVKAPDLLLLDEPTNHLDIDAVVWMEDFILRHVKTLLFVTHDRAFLKKIANRIVDLDRGRIRCYDGDYDAYLNRKQIADQAEENQNEVFDKKLSREEAWIRQGIKARRTRNEGRVRSLQKMREARRARRAKTGAVSLQAQIAEQSGRQVIEARNICYTYEGLPLIENFSTVIMRGDKVGIIGPNGTGKTTLLNLLLKRLDPQSGQVRHGTHLQVAYFDQLRDRLDESRNVREVVSGGNEFIVFNGRRRHVVSYLKDFLFSPERCRTPVSVLSGGEKNRLLLALLFTRPANVLVLDEPTNDLDVETLELLEELLFEYQGTLLVVSHDRTFLNHVVTGTLVFEGNGRVVEYAGGYDDWLSQKPQSKPAPPPAGPAPKERKPSAPVTKRKLGYMQKRELETLPRLIDTLETEQQALYAAMSDPQFYKRDKEDIAMLTARLDQVTCEIETAFARWEALEALAHPAGP